MSTSRKRGTRLDPALVYFGDEILCDMHIALQRDLMAITGESGDPHRYSLDELTMVLPRRYRQFNELLIAADGCAIREWCQESDPCFVNAWCQLVSEHLERPSMALQCECTRKRVASAIFAIRQLTGFASRLTVSGPRYLEQCVEAMNAFRARVTRPESVVEADPLFRIVGQVFFNGFSIRDIYDPNSNLPFSHGPGAVAERPPRVGLDGVAKMTVAEKATIVEAQRGAAFSSLPLDPWYGRAPMAMDIDRGNPVSQERESFSYGPGLPSLPSKVVCVPKDFRGPRVIAAMTTWKMYVQGAFDTLLRRYLRRCPFAKRIDLNDQSLNRSAALQASTNLRNATIDLKDASDMIHIKVMQELFFYRPDLWQFFLGARAGVAQFPSGEVVEMTAALTMGERKTFPLETIVLFLEPITGYLHEHKSEWTNVTWRTLCWAASRLDIRAYGDDLILNRAQLGMVQRRFAKRGYVVNTSKCCYRGFFREACGLDAWMGQDVTPLRPRQLPGADEQTLSGHLATIANMASKGLVGTAACLYDALSHVGIVPPILPTSVAIPGCVSSDRLYGLADRRAITVTKRLSRAEPDYQRPFLRVIREKAKLYNPHRDDGRYWTSLSGGDPGVERTGYPVGVVIRPTLEDSRGVEARILSKRMLAILQGRFSES